MTPARSRYRQVQARLLQAVTGRRREWRFDLVLYAWMVAVVLLPRTLLPGDDGISGWVLTGCLLLLAGAVAVSRASPSGSLLVTVLLSLAAFWFAGALWTIAYLHGRRVSAAWPALTVFGATAGVGGLVVTIRGETFTAWLAIIAMMLFAGVLPWLAGRYRRQRHELLHAGWKRAEMLEREQQVIAERAGLRERARIAEEMHDSLGHQISLMALRAGALEIAADLDERHRRAAHELRESAATATERLSEIIGVLRDSDAPSPVQPASESVADLVERARAAGVVVSLAQTDSTVPVPDLVERSAYSVVREALTNATKHAPGAPVEVRLSHSAAATTVTVTNPAPDTPPSVDRPLGQRGLVGLRERIRLLGGRLTIQPRHGGFQVDAWLPHQAGDARRSADGPAGEVTGTGPERRIEGGRRSRRGLTAATAVPLTGLVAVLLSYHVYMTFDAVLDSSDFDNLRIGTGRAEAMSTLPPRQVPGRPATEPPKPAGSMCRYYTDGSFLVRSHVYRLCFADGRLVAKDRLVASD